MFEPANAVRPILHQALVLPLLSFGAGAADGFAFLVLGGIFTANMTGNAVLATVYARPGYETVLSGAVSAIVAFALAALTGFRMTRGRGDASRVALYGAASCHIAVIALWWLGTPTSGVILLLIAASAAAMGLQTVAAKRDGVAHGATTTYATGTLTDLLGDIVDGTAHWASRRWFVLAALPIGALVAVAVATHWPSLTPLLPLATTMACIVLVSPKAAARVRSGAG